MTNDRSRVFVVVDGNGTVRDSIVLLSGEFEDEDKFFHAVTETGQALRKKYPPERYRLYRGLSDSLSAFLWAYPEIAPNRRAR